MRALDIIAVLRAYLSQRSHRKLRSSLHKTLSSLCVGALACQVVPLWAVPPSKAAANSKSEIEAVKGEIRSGDFSPAAMKLTQILRANAQAGSEVYSMLAFSQSKLGDNDAALSTCEEGLSRYPHSNALGSLYVSVLRQALSPEERMWRLQASVQRTPNSPVLSRALGEDLIASNPQDAQGFQLLSSAAILAPGDAEAHFFYGEAACSIQEDTLCIKELRRAHELAPGNSQANMQLYTMIAVAEDKLSLSKQASLDFAKAMAANRTLPHPNPYAALKYVTFLGVQNRRDQALSILEEIIRWEPTYGPAHFAHATFLSEDGKKADAVAEAELALQDARSSEAELRAYHAFLARTYFALGQREDALGHQSWLESHQQP